MPTEEEGRSRSAEFEQAIRRRIVQRTGNQIQTLEVKVIGNRVVISGRAPCYYVKQLAIQGALDVIGAAGPTQIELIDNCAAKATLLLVRRLTCSSS
jgi:hypothetical protein